MTNALVLGGADCLWADIDAALDLGEFHFIVACNDAAAVWPGHLDAAVSYHPVQWPRWLAQRAKLGLPQIAKVYGHAEAEAPRRGIYDRVHARFPGQVECGSSGLFALKVALIDLAADKAVLCGVPMDARPHFFDPASWADARVHRQGWHEALPMIAHRARSMAGWTAELLGRPDEAWLA